MAVKRRTFSKAQAWLARQLIDGQEHRLDALLISGMMAGHAEQALRQAAHALHVTRHYAQEEATLHGVFMERWQLPREAP